jgi:hypothetical protein
MSTNPLSDEAFGLWKPMHWNWQGDAAALMAWQECARRAKESRWAAFSREELEALHSGLADEIYDGTQWVQRYGQMMDEIQAELERRSK